jgi:hypothetical protein
MSSTWKRFSMAKATDTSLCYECVSMRIASHVDPSCEDEFDSDDGVEDDFDSDDEVEED